MRKQEKEEDFYDKIREYKENIEEQLDEKAKAEFRKLVDSALQFYNKHYPKLKKYKDKASILIERCVIDAVALGFLAGLGALYVGLNVLVLPLHTKDEIIATLKGALGATKEGLKKVPTIVRNEINDIRNELRDDSPIVGSAAKDLTGIASINAKEQDTKKNK